MENPRDIYSLNEGQARYILIDPALRDAGWKLDDRTQVGFEVPVDGYDAEPWNGVTDYVLHDPSGNVLAVVEAKRCSRMSGLNAKIVAALPIYLPPIKLQMEFLRLCVSHKRLRSREREALRQADHLFQSLLHRAFATSL